MNAVKRRANEKSAMAFAATCVGETEIKYGGDGYYDVHYTKQEPAKAKKLSHKLPNGEVASRSTKNAYTHVVECRIDRKDPTNDSWFACAGRDKMAIDADGWTDWGVWSWAGSEALADKVTAKVNKMSGWEARTVAIRG
jgi:hypothetical protein